MGVPVLWELISEQDQSVPIAKLAEDHFKKHARPLRIAVDEADWRFNNLTTQQVYIIREKSNEPAFQGIEKSMFYRICRLLTQNIQLLFVFDGPGRPWKRGRKGGGKIDYEKLKLFKELLRHFRIPYHEAPGEAEAECARLQQLGVVDAIFSQDSDSLMFGCDYLIRDDRIAKEKGNNDRSKENTRKNNNTVRVVRGDDIKAAHNLDKDGLVLLAMLCGGDYDMRGLPGCGKAFAPRAVKAGFGTSLCRCRTQMDCVKWRGDFVDWIQKQRRFGVSVPYDYPDIKILNKYNALKISLDEQLLNLRGLKSGWERPIDELKLLELTSSRFNIWGRLYMNWIGPVLLTKYLAARDPSLPPCNDHQIQPKRRMKKDGPRPLERNLSFSPFGLTSLQRKDFEGDRAGYWTNCMSDPFEPDYRVEKEIPEYLLRKVLLPEVLDPPPTQKTSRKRKAPTSDGDATAAPPASKRSRKATAKKSVDQISTHKSKATSTTVQTREVISLLSDSEDEPPTKNPLRSSVIDLGECLDSADDLDEEDHQLHRAIQMSLQQYESSQQGKTAAPLHDKAPTSDRDIDWKGWDPDPNSLFVPEDSPIRIGTKAPSTLPTRVTASSSRSLSERLENISKGLTASSPPLPLAIRSSVMTNADKSRTPLTRKPSATQDERASQPAHLKDMAQDPSNAVEIRAARLRVFDPSPRQNKIEEIDLT